ncbi:MAG: leucyl aminopeptidase, partial [Gammaproteobacteria bacterium]
MKNPDIKLQQHEKLPGKKQIDASEHWVMFFSSTEKMGEVAYADSLMKRRTQLGRKTFDSEPVEIDLANALGSHVVYACIDEEITQFDLLTLARKMIAAQEKHKVDRLGIAICGFGSAQGEGVAEAIIAAACAAAAVMPSYKSDKKSRSGMRRLDLHGLKAKHGFKRTFAEAEGNALARYLSILPPNELTPGNYTQRIRKLARENKWKFEFYDNKALQKKKAGAFLAVVQGSVEKDGGIVRLQYTPRTTSSRGKVVLVGKGICYDTGGTNLKPAKNMFGMHEDMQGSAVALGT